MNEPTIIDVRMHGYERITAAFVVRARLTALVETGPQSSLDDLLAGLERAGVESVDWIIVTHIHLDHAGAAGALAHRWPHARVAVHSVGAPHLAAPAKLWASAARIYGDDMDALWGGIEPVPSDRMVALDDGDVVDLGGRKLRAVATPGHAGHHHAFLDDATDIVFCGDALGVGLPDSDIIRPATPPPEFDLGQSMASIARIRACGASSAWFTHFGPHDAVAPGRDLHDTCDEAEAALQTWAGWVADARAAGAGLDDAVGRVRRAARSELEGRLSPAAIERLEHTTSYRMNVSGLMRYFDRAGSRA